MQTEISTTPAVSPALFFKRFEEPMRQSIGAYEYSPEVDGLVFRLTAAQDDLEQLPDDGSGSASGTYSSGGKWDADADADF
ncbi:hypothetical protein CYFUS_002868 [Cystobacter fuscus]|uniref:Uncharacterized protein n=1 Tax=Cystobacter fuscus TaxID=43 RepID=A0A250J2Q3_9BACT|nr:hypothetical protein [Cystobacter fuscus]ATB37446.1 hypothetical protein CYFUS_002868 [Cystobacter fuscus]